LDYEGFEPPTRRLTQRVPILFATMTLTGFEVAPLIPAPVGVATAVIETTPRFDGFQLHVAEKLDTDPEVVLFLQPGRTFPSIANVIFDATLTFAVTTIDVLYVALVADPASKSELNEEVSATSVTAMVID